MPLRLLVIGAHPDDCEYKAGGLATLYRQAGHDVRFVSVTNGESGHHQISGPELAARRKLEAAAAGRVIGIDYTVLDHRDGTLQPTLEIRWEIIALIRQYQPDLILTHRPNDYHPDHRACSQLVCDAAYLVTVPPLVPELPALRDNPVIAYLGDDFQHPYPLVPTAVLDVGSVMEQIIDMHACHVSQFYEWLPYNQRWDVPADPAGRRAWLGDHLRRQRAGVAQQYRARLQEIYGAERGSRVEYAEVFEGCEYGSPLTPERVREFFPF